MNLKTKRILFRIIEIVVLILIAVISLVPIYWGILTSIKPLNIINTFPPKFADFPVTADHYRRIFASGFLRCLLNSIFYSVISILCGLLLGYLAAYGFSRRKFFSKQFWFYLVVIGIPLSTGSSVLLIPNYLLMMKLHLTNHWFTMPLLYTAYNLPLCIWLLIAGIKAVPVEIEESASIDGCSQFYIVSRMVPPMLKPSFAAAAIFIFIGSWNEYITTSVMVNGETLKNVQMAIYDYLGVFGQEWGPLTASATVAIIPILIVFTLLGRHLVSGLTAGAVKG